MNGWRLKRRAKENRREQQMNYKNNKIGIKCEEIEYKKLIK